MGCSPSTVSPGEESTASESEKRASEQKNKSQDKTNERQKGHAKASKENNSPFHLKRESIDKNSNKLSPLDQRPVPKSIAFDLTVDGQSADGLLRAKKIPHRLQTLEPLNLPKLTAEQLEEKQRLADEKREKLKQKKIKNSQKASKRRRQLLKAQEFGMKLQSEYNEDNQMLNPGVTDEVEKYRVFNISNANSRMSIPDKINKADLDNENTLGKRAGLERMTATSENTLDSYDNAFKRSKNQEQSLQVVHNLHNNVHIMKDDFFDT